MASVRNRKGKWYYRITITNGDGTHKYVERGSWKTKREALEAGTIAERRIKDGEELTRQKFMSFNFLSKEWLESSDSRYKLSSIQSYEKEMKINILPILGDYSINVITVKLCQSVIDTAIRHGYSMRRIGRIKGCMSQCFKYAIHMGYLLTNPTRDLYLPAPRSVAIKRLKPPREIKILTHHEVEVLFNYYKEGHQNYISLLLGYRCGLRLGEVFAVMIDDIDINKRVLHLTRQVQYDHSNNNLYFTDLKYCRHGEGRDIDLDKETCKILSRHIQRVVNGIVNMNFIKYYVNKNGYINADGDGKRIYPINVDLKTGRMIKPRSTNQISMVIHGIRGNYPEPIKEWEFHSLRHTHASELIAAGMDPVSVQKRLGHKNLTTTYKYYVHETETQVTESRDILEKMYSDQLNEMKR